MLIGNKQIDFVERQKWIHILIHENYERKSAINFNVHQYATF